ncbi:MAG: T9SS type A sorting domain-containing protein [Bacteroidales bacterium]|nr:T9SS type A sorting domain-containing protein [Bacteroidales bacterium]
MKQFLIRIHCALFSLFVAIPLFAQEVSTTTQVFTGSDFGSTILVPINCSGISANYGTILTVAIKVEYNEDVLTYVGYTNLNSGISLPGAEIVFSNGIGFARVDILNESGFDYPEGKSFDLQFTFKGGTTAITFTMSEFFNDGFETLNADVINGNVSGFTALTATNGDWHQALTWTGYLGGLSAPGHGHNVTIQAGGTVVIGADAVCNNLGIYTGGQLTLNAGSTLTNNGNLHIESGGSFIQNGTLAVAGSTSIMRDIDAYTSSTDGWHLVSSPVNGAVIGNFQPGTNDDFFKYNEATSTWMSWKESPFGFTNGEGYLCSYQSSATKNFTGVPNNADVTWNNLSRTGTNGWHLLGNPFPCAIKWNDGNWALTNVNATAKVLNSGGTYTDRVANDIIPAMQGFFVDVAGSTNSITIPKAARVHNATAWYKEVQCNKLMLTAHSDDNNTYVETVIRFDPEATTGYDKMFDSHFLRGINGAPQLYSVVGDEMLSSNVFPVNSETSVVSLGFVKGNADNYTLTASGIETFVNGQPLILEDLVTGSYQDLRQNPVYSFTASAGDNPDRFRLHFSGTFDISEPSVSPFNIYVSKGILYVNYNDNQTFKGTIKVYSVTGQVIATRSLTGDRLQAIDFNGKPGCYVVRVTTGNGVYSQKVVMN